jgi:hypothetical protein
MAFVGFIRKFNTEMVRELENDSDKLHSSDDLIYFEICGVVLNSSSYELEICDFWGTLKVKKKPEMEVSEKGNYVFKIKQYIFNNKLYFQCKGFRKVSIYDEMAFNLEVKALRELKISKNEPVDHLKEK